MKKKFKKNKIKTKVKENFLRFCFFKKAQFADKDIFTIKKTEVPVNEK